MNLNGKRVALTGAAGGMGRILARRLHEKGARLALVDANADAVIELAGELEGAQAAPADLSGAAGCALAASECEKLLGGVDVLINLAGLNSFRAFEDEDPARLDALMHVNLLAPMHLTRALLPGMIARGEGRIVNIGSIFGSIGFAWFTAYSASKFGLRGFSEALRRELADTGVGVTYLAPRAVRTPMNTDAVMRMGEATGMNMDDPEHVVGRIVEAIEKERKEAYFGFPESLFVRINAILPRLVDKALASQNRIARRFAKGEE